MDVELTITKNDLSKLNVFKNDVESKIRVMQNGIRQFKTPLDLEKLGTNLLDMMVRIQNKRYKYIKKSQELTTVIRGFKFNSKEQENSQKVLGEYSNIIKKTEEALDSCRILLELFKQYKFIDRPRTKDELRIRDLKRKIAVDKFVINDLIKKREMLMNSGVHGIRFKELSCTFDEISKEIEKRECQVSDHTRLRVVQ